MSREAFWSMVILIGGGLGLALVQTLRGAPVAATYVQSVPRTADIAATDTVPAQQVAWTDYAQVPLEDRGEPGVLFSLPRTVGVWLAALLTLAVFSFLASDNPAYKLAESIFVGVSAGYVMVAGFWDQLVQNLFARLMPVTAYQLGVANLDGAETEPQWLYLVPLAMGLMMLWQLAPRGGWIARWPLAFFIGATAGIKITASFESDFLRQIQQTLLPLVAILYDGAGATRSVDFVASVQQSVRNTCIVFGVLTSLTYFFFSVEHRGVVGAASRIGIFVLMITFGAGFGYTVMGRIVLLTQRFEFLFFEWLRFASPA